MSPKRENVMRIIAYDVAGVIIDVPTRLTLEGFQKLQGRYQDIKPVAPFAQMRRVTQGFDQAYLVSGASDPAVEQMTRDWLDYWDFWDEVGIPRDHLRFCGMEPSAKSPVCRSLPMLPTHFVDDRPEFLVGLDGVVSTRILFDRGEGERPPPGVTVVRSWDELERVLSKG